jgi:hypothetical protein
MGKVDFRYYVSDERLLAYSRIPLLDRLKWLDEIARFTRMVRAAPDRNDVGEGNPVGPAEIARENN